MLEMGLLMGAYYHSLNFRGVIEHNIIYCSFTHSLHSLTQAEVAFMEDIGRFLRRVEITCDLTESLVEPPPSIMTDINVTSYSIVVEQFRTVERRQIDEIETVVLGATVIMSWEPPFEPNGELTRFQAWLGVIPLDGKESPSNEVGRSEIFSVSYLI